MKVLLLILVLVGCTSSRENWPSRQPTPSAETTATSAGEADIYGKYCAPHAVVDIPCTAIKSPEECEQEVLHVLKLAKHPKSSSDGSLLSLSAEVIGANFHICSIY